MAYGRARIYVGNDPESSIIGFSRSMLETEQQPELLETLTRLGYTARTVEKPGHSVSSTHLELRPPVQDEHLRIIAGAILRVADLGHDGVVVLDNRVGPAVPFDGKNIIAQQG